MKMKNEIDIRRRKHVIDIDSLRFHLALASHPHLHPSFPEYGIQLKCRFFLSVDEKVLPLHICVIVIVSCCQ
jgi:hypothetical protein